MTTGAHLLNILDKQTPGAHIAQMFTEIPQRLNFHKKRKTKDREMHISLTTLGK